MSKHRMIQVESAKSSLRVAVANAAAEGIICGFDEATENGHPLSQVQRIDMAKMAMMAVATTVAEHEKTLDFEAEFITAHPREES